MKCENCGKNEVTFVYRSNLNGQVEEKCLCAECAEKLGYTRRLGARNRTIIQNIGTFFGDSNGNLLGGFFFPAIMGRMLDNPFDDFFTEMPALGASPAAEERAEELIAREEMSRFDRARRLNALRHGMEQAVAREDFEQAAQIRDEIRRLESEAPAVEE